MFLLSCLKTNLSHNNNVFCIWPTFGLLLVLDVMGLYDFTILFGRQICLRTITFSVFCLLFRPDVTFMVD